jgi:signal transduction histidine kinase
VGRRVLPAVLRYVVAAGVFALLVGISRGARAAFGFSVDTTSLIIIAMIGSAWYLGRGPGLLVAILFEGMLDYYAGWPKDPVRFGVIAFNRIVLFGSVVWFASTRRQAERALKGQQDALAQALDGERAARQEAENANRLKDDFLATVSHELRTPLNVMLGWAAMLNRHNVDIKTVRKAADAIERSARTQSQIVGDILDTSRIVTGQLRLDQELIEMSAIVADTVETLRVAATAKSLALNIEPSPGLVLGDAVRLRQISWNILVNAIKFTPPGGTVNVRVQQNGDWVEFVVADTGEGIDPAFVPRLFERFAQADASMTREHGGLGLGLAIVRHLVDLHGGTVEATSPGRQLGATFTVRLPAARASAGATTTLESVEAASL